MKRPELSRHPAIQKAQSTCTVFEEGRPVLYGPDGQQITLRVPIGFKPAKRDERG